MSSLPHIKHPKVFKIGAIHIGVMSYFPLSDDQAAKVAMYAYRTPKWTRKDEKKMHFQYWTGDRDALALLG
ncbi:hypothetical protein J2W37_002824 [Variovorax paradoxus]|uniref:hypothetical protein n=1 Tax=Variovorax paradoxus TaxID=34073 RepID=UPI002780B4B3|nr:hypothetical protein [Variovorax paradoxus]MDP9965104.1 hypothetical protein [Variovorax paradoxus]